MSTKRTVDDLKNMKALGHVLRLARKQIKKTQGAVAEEVGLSRPTLVAIEAGDRQVSAVELRRFAQCYDVSVEDLHRACETATLQIEFLSLTEKQKRLIHTLLMIKPDKKIVRTLQFVGMKREELEQIASALLHELLETENIKVTEQNGQFLAEYESHI